MNLYCFYQQLVGDYIKKKKKNNEDMTYTQYGAYRNMVIKDTCLNYSSNNIFLAVKQITLENILKQIHI